MLKRMLLVGSLLMPLAVPTVALADAAPQSGAAASQPSQKNKTSRKNRKAKDTRHQGRKGSRAARRQGASRAPKSTSLNK
jgi:hypothetical protein